MTNPITRVNVFQLKAPIPSAFQKTGAFLSQGATNLGVNGRALLTQFSDLTPILQAPLPLASLTSSGLVATATLEGAASDISSASYNSATGLVTLTLNASLGVAEGDLILTANLTGTGAYTQAEGTFACGPGTSGETVTYYIPTALTLTITGGDAEATMGLADGTQFPVTIAGAQPSGYNGTFLATVTSANQFTYPIAATLTSPATGSPTTTPPGQQELVSMATTFFAQGSGQAAYVLELGSGDAVQGIAALSTYLENNPNTQPNQTGQLPNAFYSYLVPRSWDGVSEFLTLLGEYQNTTSEMYFFVTTTLANYASYASMKNVVAMVEAPTVLPGAVEFSLASVFWVTLNYAPSSSNLVTPLNLSYLYDVTAYPTQGNSSVLSTLNAANVNVVQTAAQGGLSGYILIGGNTMDGNPFNYWYSVDWAQITSQQAINAALINGSNNPVNPLYYDQNGINTLQQVVAGVFNSGISYGLVLNPVKTTGLSAAQLQAALDAGTYDNFTLINADPFTSYTAENPSDYTTGNYGGLTASYVPLRGFSSIVFNIDVSNFVQG